MISNKLKRIFASNGVQVLLCIFMLLFDVAYAEIPEWEDALSVNVKTTTNSVTLTWNSVTNASSYQVVFNGKTNIVTKTTFSASDLTASKEYSYSVGVMGENHTVSMVATGTAETEGGKDPEKVKWDKWYLWVFVIFVAVAIIGVILYYKRKSTKYCQDCGYPLYYNGKCTNPDCPTNQPPPPPKCNICGGNLDANGKCTNPNCPSIPRCKICSYQLYANGECSNPNCPGKSRICEFCNKIITEAHKQDQLCPSNWINPIKLDKDKIWIKREPNAQGGQGHIHPVWVKDSPIEWLYKNFASNKIFELEWQTLFYLNKEGIDFVPEFYRKHEKGFIMSKADGDNLNNVFGLKGTKETKQIEKVKIIRFIKKMCDAIEKLHLKGISHRDLKPVNIFYDLGKEKITIIDFGSVAIKEKGNSNSKAPFGDDYKCGKDEGVDFESGKQRDIYAVGIIIKEIWEKSLLEDKQEIYDILYKTTCDNQKERVNITELINFIESKWGALK